MNIFSYILENNFCFMNNKNIPQSLTFSPLVGKGNWRKAFTLVELIIVITILAILATIAFMSFQGYSSNSRDSNRVTTVKNIETWIDVFFTKSGKVPSPDTIIGTGIIGWSTVWYVGKIGVGIARQINLNETPLDPLSQTAYMYGSDAGNRYYQIGLTLESQTAMQPWISSTYAENQKQAKVSGNYAWLLKYNGMIYNLPSLLYTGSGNLLSGQTYFIVDKGQNVPYSVDNSLTGSEIFKLVWSTATSITGITLPSDANFYKANYLTYTNQLWYEVDLIWVALYGKDYTPIQTQCAVWIEEISLWNGQIWSCKNLWATTVRDGNVGTLTNCGWSATNCNASLTRLWDYYQWGRNDTGWTNWQSWNPYNNWWEAQNDIKWGWSTSDSWTANGSWTTNEGRQWPCPSGWHVPSAKDWQNACNSILWTTCINGMIYNSLISTKLRLPFAGYRNRDNGYYYNQSTRAYYWSSSPSSTYSYNLNFTNDSNINPAGNKERAYGFSVRCIKN